MADTDGSSGWTPGGIAWDAAGTGAPVVLAHAGVADRRMWDLQWPALATRHRVVRFDARGFGESRPPAGEWSGHGDVVEVIESVAREAAVLVGASLGGGLAVEAAVARPDLVRGLVLAAPGGSLLDPGEDVLAAWQAEEEALERGDVEAAVEVNLRAWVDGPRRRQDAVDPGLRAWIGGMQRQAFELPPFDPEGARHVPLEPPAIDRLGEIRVPVLVILGELDDPSVNAAGERVAAGVPSARVERWPDVGHLPSIEQPDRFVEAVVTFTDGLDGAT